MPAKQELGASDLAPCVLMCLTLGSALRSVQGNRHVVGIPGHSSHPATGGQGEGRSRRGEGFMGRIEVDGVAAPQLQVGFRIPVQSKRLFRRLKNRLFQVGFRTGVPSLNPWRAVQDSRQCTHA